MSCTALAALALLGIGCREESSAPPSNVDTARPTPPPRAGMPDPNAPPEKGDPNPMRIFESDEAPRAPEYALKEMAFEERSDGLPTAGTWRGYPLLCDFNADGRADIVASNREEDGFSTWESPHKGIWIRHIEGLPRDLGYGPAQGGDVDGDGDVDLVLSAHTDALTVYLNDGHMVWTRGESPILHPFLLIDIALGDLNGDKRLDCVGMAHFKGGLSVYLGDGKGGFELLAEGRNILPSDHFGTDVELGDVDGDGTPDLVMATDHGARVFLTRPGEPMRWEEISAGLPRPAIGNSLQAVRVGQFVAGSRPEIAVCARADPGIPADKRDDLGIFGWDADGKIWKQIDHGLPQSDSFNALHACDLDRDGHLDLVVLSPQHGGAIFLGDGAGGFTAKGRLAGVHGKGYLASGDIDADGWTDIVVAVPATKDRPEGGGVRLFRNKPELWR